MAFSIPDFRFLIVIKSQIMKLRLKIPKRVPKITESDFGDYLHNLEDYEVRLARGEIK